MPIISDRSLTSWAAGIGFSWSKFTACASDWDIYEPCPDAPILRNGIKVSGWDIWGGGVINAVVPRAYADTTEKLLGKRGCTNDRHTIAALDTITKVRNIRSRIATIRTWWDETATMWQPIARGIVGYAPLIDTFST